MNTQEKTERIVAILATIIGLFIVGAVFTPVLADSFNNGQQPGAYTGNSNWSGGPLAIENGGTNATSASAAQTSLGLAIGTNVQAYDADLTLLGGVNASANTFPYYNTNTTALGASLTAAGRALLDDANAAAQRATLDLEPGADIQAYDADLATIAGFTAAENTFIVGTSTGWHLEGPTAALSSLGAGTMAKQNADAVAITGGTASGLAYVGFVADTDHDNTPAVSCLWLTDIGLFLVAPNKTIYPVQIGAGKPPAS